MHRALAETASLWPELRKAYNWIYEAAQLLSNEEGLNVYELRRAYRKLLAQIAPERKKTRNITLSYFAQRFVTTTKNYWNGLFACYQIADLPKTNNDLERYFGSARYHERRASGRKGSSPAMVIRGSVKIVAAVATQLQTFGALELQPSEIEQWQALRGALEARREGRRAQLRFRQDPQAYLGGLEEQLLK